MSFIRSGTNPEGLYVYHDVGEFISLSHKGTRGQPPWEIPVDDFYLLVANYQNEGEPVKAGALSLREAYVCPKGHRHREKCKLGGQLVCGTYQMRLSFEGRGHVDMWQVTWDYIVKNVIQARLR